MITMNDHDLTPEQIAELEVLSQDLNVEIEPTPETIEELQARIEELEEKVSDLEDEVENQTQRGDNNYNDFDNEREYQKVLEERRSKMYTQLEDLADTLTLEDSVKLNAIVQKLSFIEDHPELDEDE